MVDPSLIACHCGLQNWFSSLNRRRCERAISNRRLFTLTSDILVPSAHTLCDVPVLQGQRFVGFRLTTPAQWIDFELRPVGLTKSVPLFVLRLHRTLLYRHDHGHGFSVHQFLNLRHFRHTALSLRHHRTLQLLVRQFRRWVYIHCP